MQRERERERERGEGDALRRIQSLKLHLPQWCDAAVHTEHTIRHDELDVSVSSLLEVSLQLLHVCSNGRPVRGQGAGRQVGGGGGEGREGG